MLSMMIHKTKQIFANLAEVCKLQPVIKMWLVSWQIILIIGITFLDHAVQGFKLNVSSDIDLLFISSFYFKHIWFFFHFGDIYLYEIKNIF